MSKRIEKDIRFSFETGVIEVFKSSDGSPHIRAVASDSLEDRQGDVITETCVQSMATQVRKNEIPLLPDHRSSFEMGKSTGGDTRRNVSTNGLELVVEFRLDDDYTESKKLYREVEVGKCRRQLSIGGYLNKNNPRAAYMERRDGKIVMVLDDIVLDHIAVTREGKAANPRTNFVDAVVKSIDEAGYAVTEAGLVQKTETEDAEDIPTALPITISKLDQKSVIFWKRVWKDTFIRQLHNSDQSVGQAELAAGGVATAMLSKQLGHKIDVNPGELAVARTEKETFVLGTTSKVNGHTHLWVGKMVEEKIIDGLMLTVKGHDHNISAIGECEPDRDHAHALVRKEQKVAEPSSDEHPAPVGLLYFGKGSTENSVQLWLEAHGIEPLSVTCVANSTFEVEFSLSPLADEETKKEDTEMPKGQETPVEKAAVVYKDWPLSDQRSWSWTAADGNAVLGPKGDNWEKYKAAHTYFDDSKGSAPALKGAYSMPHHKNADGGLSTYIGGVIAATAILNGARGGFRRDTSDAGRKALHSHLSKHYSQAGRVAPPLKEKWMDRMKEGFSHPNPKTLAERDYEDFVFSMELAKEEVPAFLTKEWWMTWDQDATGSVEIPAAEKSIWSLEVEKVAPSAVATPEVKADEKEKSTAPAEVKTEVKADAKVDAPAKEKSEGKTDVKAEAPTDSKPVVKAAEAAPAANVPSGSTDSNAAVAPAAAPTKEDNGDPVTRAIAELAATMQKALADIGATVSAVSARIDVLEKPKTEKTSDPVVVATTTGTAATTSVVAEINPVAPQKTVSVDLVIPAAPAVAVANTPVATPVVAVQPATTPQPAPAAEKSVAPETKPAPEAAPSPDKKNENIFGAFHALLEGMGLTSKDFLEAMAQKSLEMTKKSMDGVGSSIMGTVQKAVESSVGSLRDGVKADVEKSVKATLDAKLAEAAKAFDETVEKLNGRLENVEKVGGVRQGADGQETLPSRQESGTFAGVFSRALRRR